MAAKFLTQFGSNRTQKGLKGRGELGSPDWMLSLPEVGSLEGVFAGGG